MGLFHEYLKNPPDPKKLDELRKEQLQRIAKIRNSAVLSYAARIAPLPPNVDPSVSYEDLLPITDLLSDFKEERLTVILETPGGFGEVGRDLVEMMHDKFKHLTFIVPGMAKSTGTIMCMGGHEIMMGPGSALGPIDAQLIQDGKRFSADALLEGLESLKVEIAANGGQLNPIHIPMLQRLSPGEIQNAKNALEFARATVRDWLVNYKFADWKKDGVPVTDEKKKQRAAEIAAELSKQSRWFTHARSLRIQDLEELGLKIEDFTKTPDLSDAVMRYHVLLRMTFDAGPVYKIYETPDTLAARRFNVPALNPDQTANLIGAMQAAPFVQFEAQCTKCGVKYPVQIDFAPGQPLQPGSLRYPDSGQMPCPKCKQPVELSRARTDIEKHLGKKAITPQPKT